MNRILLATALILLVAPSANASTATVTMRACGAAWTAMSPADKAKTTYRAFSTACLKNRGPAAVTTTQGAATPLSTPAAATTTHTNRMTVCAAKWQDLKKQGKTGGQTYTQFSAVCLRG